MLPAHTKGNIVGIQHSLFLDIVFLLHYPVKQVDCQTQEQDIKINITTPSQMANHHK